MAGQPTSGHDVVYVTTENNTIYAIDAISGTILGTRNLGSPVPYPLGCGNNGPNVGINSTPVIDASTHTMYVIAYTLESGTPVYRIHAIDITTLQDTASTKISASHTLTSGQAYVFNPAVQRQRAALLEANGNIYAAFASFCDFAQDQSRGWILGWNAASLAPLASNQLTNTQVSGQFYLSSIWMSGSGLAAYDGYVVAVTGNSNPNGTSYDAAGGTNYAESILKISPDLTKVVDWFTPPNVAELENYDYDFGSGGVLLLPAGFSNANGSVGLAAAAGKDGNMYVVDMDNLGHGGYAASSPAPLAVAQIGYCWCAESYFVGQHGPTIVSSGGGNGQVLAMQPNDSAGPTEPEMVELWSLPNQISSSGSLLTQVGASQDLSGTPQDGGLFTSVSSLGSNNVIIWALSRPDGTTDQTGNYPMHLYAFGETLTNGKLTQLFEAVAGEWAASGMGGNSNIVPVVANGQVYVATYKQLQIFGLAAG